MRNYRSLLLTCSIMLIAAPLLAQSTQSPNSIKLFFEKVFIHTDRIVYAPGEDVWFKAYVTNARDNHLIGTSKNLYVELIAPADTLVKKHIIRLDNGTCKGDFALTDNLPAGNYRLRAYTNWMRNFGDKFIFEKTISITGNGMVDKNAAAKQPFTNGIKSSSASPAGNGPVIRFFPEGGSLVNELSAVVAVKAEDAQGNGLPVSGPVISAAGDTVAKFTCDSLGMGLFTILPFAGQTYSTKLIYKGQSISVALPAALNSGLALKVLKRDTLFYITISGNNAAAAALAGKALTLSAKHAGATFIDQQIQLTNNQALVKIPEGILPEGIIAFTLYDDQHKPNCERLVYNDRPAHAAKLLLGIAKSTYASRERVAVNIKAFDGNKRPVAGNFSVAVVDAGINTPEVDNIQSYLNLQSEIKGQIARPGRYFDTTNVNRAKQLDMLLLTQGWRDFVWKKLAESPINIAYLPEQGFTLSGKVKKESNNKPVPNSNITLSAPKAIGSKLFFTKTDTTGNYYFDNLQLFGDQNVRVTTRDVKGKANGIIEIDSLSTRNLPVGKIPVVASPAIGNDLTAEIERRATITKKMDSVTNLREVQIKGNRKVQLRDQIAITGGYKDEVLTVTKDDLTFKNLGGYILYASKQAKTDPNPLATGNNIVFFSGGKTYKPRIIVDNTELPFTEDDEEALLDHYYNTYYSLPMTVVEKVVIKHLIGGLKPPAIGGTETANAMGNSVAGAKALPTGDLFVIYLTLKPGALLRNNGRITTANIQGYYETRSFYKPLYVGPAKARADIRNTIHWEPIVKTDANGNADISYYNADPKSKIRIVVQGITDSGEPVSAVKGYVVK